MVLSSRKGFVESFNLMIAPARFGAEFDMGTGRKGFDFASIWF